MADEFLTLGSEATRRLEALSKQWNDVRNAALGRGTKPLVSAALADDVAAEHMAYHEWRQGLSGLTFTWSFTDELNDWTRRCNAARARVAAEFAKLKGAPLLPPKLTEWREMAPAAVQSVFTAFAGMSGLALGAGLILLLASRRKKAA